jgi:cytoskeletal protein CcmA (bactofilin family)
MKLLARTDSPVSGSTALSAPKSELNGLLGKGSTFEGKLVFEGLVHLNGNFIGEVHTPDTIVVGEGAKVDGTIVAGTVIISGDVQGEIRATEVIEMHAPARVRAAITTPQLIIERGVLFEGASRMEPPKVPAATANTATTQPPKPVQKVG